MVVSTKKKFRANAQDMEQLATLFRVLADPVRMQILLYLTGGEKNVSTISEALRLPQPTVSHHLALLRMHNIVGHRREGKQVIYGIEGRVCVDIQNEVSLFVQNHVVRIGMRSDVN